jgi:hypothetical protein
MEEGLGTVLVRRGVNIALAENPYIILADSRQRRLSVLEPKELTLPARWVIRPNDKEA